MGFLSGIGQFVNAVAPIANFVQQDQQNQQNVDMWKRSMRQDAAMSNTAHQREVIDLKKAGLNPILSAGGGGASTPSSSSPTLAAPQIDTDSILQVMKMDQDQQRIDVDKMLASSTVAKNLNEQDLTKAKKIMLEKQFNKADVQNSLWDVLNKAIKGTKKGIKQKSQDPQINSIMNDMGYP